MNDIKIGNHCSLEKRFFKNLDFSLDIWSKWAEEAKLSLSLILHSFGATSLLVSYRLVSFTFQSCVGVNLSKFFATQSNKSGPAKSTPPGSL